MKSLTIVTPCFNEAENIRTCVLAVVQAVGSSDFQHLFIDNKSTDDSLAVLYRLKEEFPHLRVLSNSHNVGVFSSLHRALREVKTEWVVPFFAADLQDPARVIREMIDLQKETGAESIFAIRSIRAEKWLLSLMRSTFYRVLRSATKGAYVIGTSEFCLIRVKAIRPLLQLNDPSPFLRVYLSQLSGDVRYIDFKMEARTKGSSSANIFSLVDDAMNGISLVLPPVFSKIMVASAFTLVIGLVMTIFALIDIAFLPFNFGQLFSVGIIVSGFSMLFGLVALVGQYVYLIHNQVRTRVVANTIEHF